VVVVVVAVKSWIWAQTGLGSVERLGSSLADWAEAVCFGPVKKRLGGMGEIWRPAQWVAAPRLASEVLPRQPRPHLKTKPSLPKVVFGASCMGFWGEG
jgi:hypothetical protein